MPVPRCSKCWVGAIIFLREATGCGGRELAAPQCHAAIPRGPPLLAAVPANTAHHLGLPPNPPSPVRTKFNQAEGKGPPMGEKSLEACRLRWALSCIVSSPEHVFQTKGSMALKASVPPPRPLPHPGQDQIQQG